MYSLNLYKSFQHIPHWLVELVDVIEVLFGKSTERRKRAILGELMEDFDGVRLGIS